MKTKEELNALKEEVETLNKKLAELTVEELAEVAGGAQSNPCTIRIQWEKACLVLNPKAKLNWIKAMINHCDEYKRMGADCAGCTLVREYHRLNH